MSNIPRSAGSHHSQAPPSTPPYGGFQHQQRAPPPFSSGPSMGFAASGMNAPAAGGAAAGGVSAGGGDGSLGTTESTTAVSGHDSMESTENEPRKRKKRYQHLP